MNNQLLHDSSYARRIIATTLLLVSGIYIVTVNAAVQCNIGLKMFSYENGNAICAPISSYKCIESCEWNTSCSLTSHYAAFRGRRSYVSGMVLTNNSFLVQCCASLSTIVQMNAQHEPICVWVETPETVESKANVRFDPPLAANEYVREMFVERRGRGRVSVKAQICKFVVQRTNCDKKTMTEEETHAYSLLQLRLSRTKEILNGSIMKLSTTTTAAPSDETNPTKDANNSAIVADSFRDQKPLATSRLLSELNSVNDNKQVSIRANKTQEHKSQQNEILAEIKPPHQYRTTMRSSLGKTNHSENAESTPIFNSTIFDVPQHTVIGGNQENRQQSMAVLTFAESGHHGEQARITEAIHDAVYRHMIHKDQPMISTAVGRRILSSNIRNNDATISPRVHSMRHATTEGGGVQRRSAPDDANLAMAAPRRWAEHHLLQIKHDDDSIAEWPREATAAHLAALHGNKSASKPVRHQRPIFASLNGSYEYFSSNKHRDDRRQNALTSRRRLGLRQIHSSKNAINGTLGLRSSGSHLRSAHAHHASVAAPQGEELPMKNELQIRKLKTVTMESLGSTPIGPQPIAPKIENNDDGDNEEFKRATSFGGSFADLRDYYSATNNHLLKPVQQQQIQSSGLEVRSNGPLLKAPSFRIIPLQPQQQGFLSFTANSSDVLQRPTSVAQALLIKQRQRQIILERRRLEQQQEQQQLKVKQEQLLKSSFAELEAIRASTAATAVSNRQPNSGGAALSHSSLNNLLDCCQKQAPGCKNLCSKDVSKDEIKHALVSQQCPPLSMTSVIQCFPRYYNISSVTQCCANAARPIRQPTSDGGARLPEQCLGLCAPDFKLSFAHFACIDHISSIVECYRDLLK